MFKNINQCDVYVALWSLYMLQGMLYPQGIINKSLQLIMLLWGIIALFKYLIQTTESSAILKATLMLIAMYTIYGGIYIMFGEPIMGNKQYLYLQASLNSLVPIFLFYSFTIDGKLTSDRIKIYLPILIVICILLYYKKESQVLLERDTQGITNNAAYFFVALIPFLFFYVKKPILQYLFLGIILLYIFMGMKRGAILIGVVASILFLYANVKNSSRRTKVLFIMLTIVIVIGVSKYIDYMMNNSEYFMTRYEQTLEGNSSGRDVIYDNLWDILMSESNPFYFYLGRGAKSTLKIIGNGAHQDWLETFCNNGFLGVLILFFFFYTFAKNVWRSKQYFPRMIFYSFATLFIITFSKTLFSMSIQNLDLPITMLLGYFAYRLSQPVDDFEIYEYEQDE